MLMKPGVIVDVAVDQGGCIETSQPTTHSDGLFIEKVVFHYCVANMPGAVGRISAFAFSNVILPYAIALADHGVKSAVERSPDLESAFNIYEGNVTNRPVAEAFD